jgi:hypothetical protein
MQYRKIKKQLTSQEAQDEIKKVLCNIENFQEAILTWQRGVKGIILCVIEKEFGSVENAIKLNTDKIEWSIKRIEDLKTFIK